MLGTAKPFLKWAGGKGQLIEELWCRCPPEFQLYYEPFCGGAALFYELYNQGDIAGTKEKLHQGQLTGWAHLSDINSELVLTYKAVRDNVEDVIFWLENVYATDMSEDFYYQVRETDPTILSLAERAARMIYLNRRGFNGLYRVNKEGKFNVPVGEFKKPPKILDKDRLHEASTALCFASIDCCHYGAVLDRAKAGDFVYFDPPYIPLSETSNFVSFTKDGFSDDDHRVLAEVARELKNKGVYVMISNSDTPLARELYKDFFIQNVRARRNINSRGTGRGPITELVITGYMHEVEDEFRPTLQV